MLRGLPNYLLGGMYRGSYQVIAIAMVELKDKSLRLCVGEHTKSITVRSLKIKLFILPERFPFVQRTKAL